MKPLCNKLKQARERNELAPDQYIYCMDLVKKYPELLTESSMRSLLRNRQTNGLSRAVRQVGKRLFIHLPSFEAWLHPTGKRH